MSEPFAVARTGGPAAPAASAGAAADGAVPADAAAADAVALSFRDVAFSYGRPRARSGARRVVDGLSWDVACGHVTGLLGLNGCGKSTLLRLACGLAAPSSGEVWVRDPDACAPAGGAHGAGERGDEGVGGALVPLAGLPADARARSVALLMQIHRTPSMTVEDLVLCGRYAHVGAFGYARAEDRRIAWEAMEEAGVASLARHNARSLSGGQRQRAFIAMALAQQARLLLLDEPITFLDPRAARDVMSLVRRLARGRGLTMLAVLHDVDLALRFCDVVAVMEGGRIADSGPAARVLHDGAVQRALSVHIERHEGPAGPSYAVF